MRDELKLCVVQMTSAADYAPNIAVMRNAAEQAAASDCDLMALPEVAGLMNLRAMPADFVLSADNPFISACQEAARQHNIWINTGSTPVQGQGGRSLNHGSLIAPDGAITAEYNKIHLFDITLEGQKPTGESKRFAPGTHATLAQTPWGLWGMAICYDVRFAALFRSYAQAGARLIFVPAAFTVPTGKAHWHTLLRARAIENLCWIVAPAQTGKHEDGRETFGHSLVINPWGEIMLDMGTEPGTAMLSIDLSEADKARAQIPSLTHDRVFEVQHS
ncbi:carbon-nitrogen hydrolase family protein [Halovulum sp. GXIMD14793]